MSETIKVTIDPDGTPTIEVSGVKGAGCKALTKAIEGALGRVTSDTPTGDMHAHATIKAGN